MDTSIIHIIEGSCIIKYKKNGNIYLINNWNGNLLAHYIDGKWKSATGELSLEIDLDWLDNQTDMDKESAWEIIAG